MSLPFYQEITITLDGEGDGTISFQPTPTYGTSSVTLQIVGTTTGQGTVLLGANPLALIAITQPFGPFNVPPLTAVNVPVTGGNTGVVLKCVLQGACYLPSEDLPAQNLQVGAISSGGTENWTPLFSGQLPEPDPPLPNPNWQWVSDKFDVTGYQSLRVVLLVVDSQSVPS